MVTVKIATAAVAVKCVGLYLAVTTTATTTTIAAVCG